MIISDEAYVVLQPIPGGFRYLKSGGWRVRISQAQIFDTLDEAETEAAKHDGATTAPLQIQDHLQQGRLRWKGYIKGKLYRIERYNSPDGPQDIVRALTANGWGTFEKQPLLDEETLRLIYETYLKSITHPVPDVLEVDFRSPFFKHDLKTKWPNHHVRRLADPNQIWLLQSGAVKIVLQHKKTNRNP